MSLITKKCAHIVQTGAKKLKMNAKPFGQSYTTRNLKHQRMKVEVQNKREKACTICEIAESVASTILQFFGSRNWQRYNDGETQPKTQNKLAPTTE